MRRARSPRGMGQPPWPPGRMSRDPSEQVRSTVRQEPVIRSLAPAAQALMREAATRAMRIGAASSRRDAVSKVAANRTGRRRSRPRPTPTAASALTEPAASIAAALPGASVAAALPAVSVRLVVTAVEATALPGASVAAALPAAPVGDRPTASPLRAALVAAVAVVTVLAAVVAAAIAPAADTTDDKWGRLSACLVA